MRFQNRLARLGSPAAPKQATPQLADGAHPEAEHSQGGDSFSQLRQRMAQALGKPIAHSLTERPSKDTYRLPFERADSTSGPLHQRIVLPPSEVRVGRMELATAAHGSSEMLSLLALDPKLRNCAPPGALYFDTETTGLGGAGTVAFLVGLAWFNAQGRLVLEQLLLRDPSSERALLDRVSQLMTQASMLVSFNGKSFDLPLLKARCVMAQAEPPPPRPHLDLLHVCRRLHKPRLSRFRLTDMEKSVLGWQRDSADIPGAEIAPRYGHFLRTGDDEALRQVVDHNAWDVLSMVGLVALYGEPLARVSDNDLLGISRVLTRAGAFDQAEQAADRALEAGEGSEALRVRARLHKARGDKSRALLDFERLASEVDDPSVRLELAKLYEHYAKDFEAALQQTAQGTGEGHAAEEKRAERLRKRARRAAGR